jgi:hypothetical protein
MSCLQQQNKQQSAFISLQDRPAGCCCSPAWCACGCIKSYANTCAALNRYVMLLQAYSSTTKRAETSSVLLLNMSCCAECADESSAARMHLVSWSWVATLTAVPERPADVQSKGAGCVTCYQAKAVHVMCASGKQGHAAALVPGVSLL